MTSFEPMSNTSDQQAPHDASQADSRSQGLPARSGPSYVVGIGASAGGLEALERLFQEMPCDTGMAFVVVQHLSPDFKSLMDELLARWTRMPIHTVTDGMAVKANEIYLMPPNTEMIISDGKLLLTARDRSDELRLPIDQFFRSLARDCGRQAVAVVLSGTGSDGSRGICDVHESGGLVLAQSYETAKFDGMPKSAMETGFVDAALSPAEIRDELLRHVNHPRAATQPAGDGDEMTPVLRLLREVYGIDFSLYKPSTVLRRTERRLQLGRVDNLQQYADQLRENREELDALYRDLLIGVTSFFRDAAAFQLLEDRVLPELLERVSEGNDFRAWVAGCATGEEAYSLAILIHEQIQRSGKQIDAKIFATDVHARSLEFAAAGEYSEDAVASVTAQRLKEYFVRTHSGYRVSPELRNMVVFAPHNIIKDAHFTRLDLIACRNLLIYLIPPAQKKALCLFHFGLRTGGLLFLGPSESPGDLTSEFETIDQHWKIFKKQRDVKLLADLRLPLSGGATHPITSRGVLTPRRTEAEPASLFEELLHSELPPSILVNEQLEIVHTFGDANRYLRLQKGMPSLGLLQMLSNELRTAVAAAIHRATREKKKIAFRSVRALTGEGETSVDITATPFPATRQFAFHTLITFGAAESAPAASSTDLNLSETTRDHIEALETELRFTKENLQAAIEELETSNEELQATNEELLASNEELQSTNEELHSVNEELYTVNAEYQKKIHELTELSHDMDNLLMSTDVHTIFLDENLCIRKFTPRMAQVFNLIATDIGRKIDGFVHTIECEDLLGKLASVLETGSLIEEEASSSQGDYYLMRILPYRSDTDLSGVVLTLIDITVLKATESKFVNAVEVSPNGMLIVDSDGLITMSNSEVERMFGYSPGGLIGRSLESLMPASERVHHQDLRHKYFGNPYIIRRMSGNSYVWGERKDGKRIPLDVRVNPIRTPLGVQAIASVVDVSDHHKLESSLRKQVNQRDRFLATLSHELRNPMAAILSAASLLDQLGQDAPGIVNASGVIRRQASQMATLLDDLLDVSRVTQGKIKLRLEPVELATVIREGIEAVGQLVASHKHHLRFDAPQKEIWVNADRVRLLQVVENLLTNATKYTPDGGDISLSLQRQDSTAVIKVRDNGCGMTKPLLDSIFDMFVQSDQTLDRSEGGMGVGLTLVRSLVELHQGTVVAHSDGPGKGSEFTVELPITDARPLKRIQRPSERQPSELRIVLVEDNDDAREMLESLLVRSGYRVVATASDGRVGLDRIIEHQPDACVLDIGLPGLDGYQIARQVRERLGASIRLIALTGYGQASDQEAVLEAGFNEHLVKPVGLKDLNAALLAAT
jgi:two-component system CheB/CheR fusion protein